MAKNEHPSFGRFMEEWFAEFQVIRAQAIEEACKVALDNSCGVIVYDWQDAVTMHVEAQPRLDLAACTIQYVSAPPPHTALVARSATLALSDTGKDS